MSEKIYGKRPDDPHGRKHDDDSLKAAQKAGSELEHLRQELVGLKQEVAEARKESREARESAAASQQAAQDIQKSVERTHWIRAYVAIIALVVSVLSLGVAIYAAYPKSPPSNQMQTPSTSPAIGGEQRN